MPVALLSVGTGGGQEEHAAPFVHVRPRVLQATPILSSGGWGDKYGGDAIVQGENRKVITSPSATT